jgi:hypothetical protein
VPQPPTKGLIVRGYCTYLKLDDQQRAQRSRELYYRENPDRWAAETHSDLLSLTEAEWRSLIPADGAPGDKSEVARATLWHGRRLGTTSFVAKGMA